MWIRQTTIWLQISSLNFSIGSICKTNGSSSIKDQHKIQSGCCKCNNAVLLCKMLDNVLWTDVFFFLALLLPLLALCEEKKKISGENMIWEDLKKKKKKILSNPKESLRCSGKERRDDCWLKPEGGISQLDRSKAAVKRLEMTHACRGELVLHLLEV